MSTVTFSGDLTETVTYRTIEETTVIYEVRCHDCGTEARIDDVSGEAIRWAHDHECPRCAVCDEVLTEDGELCGTIDCARRAGWMGLRHE